LDEAVFDVLFGTTALSTYAGADTSGTTTLLTRLPSAITLAGGAVTVGTNNDKTGYSIGAGGISSTSFAANAIDSSSVATNTVQEVADGILLRKLDRTGDGTDAANERTVVNALRALRNKQSISAGTLTVTKEDDATTAWTAAVTTTAGDPLSSIDPT
jgi:predicted lipoprotein with Yx(FWY)xxD motif